MRRMLSYLLSHKFVTLLVLVIAYLLFKGNNVVPLNQYGVSYRTAQSGQSFNMKAPSTVGSYSDSLGISPGSLGMESTGYNPSTGGAGGERMVVKSSNLSLLVKNVTDTKDAILEKTAQLGGFMVNVYVSNPEDQASATISVRVPSEKMDEALKAFRGLSVKVIQENLEGTDVTDQYSDIKAQMTTLLTTKAKFEEILDKATEIQDILNVQREIITLQSQIDSLKGQEQYLEKNTQMSQLTIYLSTDELALPYSTEFSWRPELIFKQAVRSLFTFIRQIGTLLIWVVVYSVIWIPLLIIYFISKKWRQKAQTAKLNN